MTIRPPGWMQLPTVGGGSYSAENDRLANLPWTSSVGSSTSAQFTGNNGWDGGVGQNYNNNCFKVLQHAAGANMSVDVNPGFGWAPGQSTTTQGMYTVTSDAIVTLAITTSNPTNPRIDLVYLQVRDAAYSGSFSDFQIVVVTGTPAVSPTVPALPANSIPLARVAVAANASTIVTANITDVRLVLGSSGGFLQAPSGFRPIYAPTGQRLVEPDTGKHKIFSAANVWEDFYLPGAWTAYNPVWASSGTAPTIGNGSLTGRYFKVGRHVTAQVVWVAGSTTAFGTGNYTWSLPFATATTVECAAGSYIGTCANNITIGVSDIINNGGQVGFLWATANIAANTQVGRSQPATFVNGDSLRMLFVYESAS